MMLNNIHSTPPIALIHAISRVSLAVTALVFVCSEICAQSWISLRPFENENDSIEESLAAQYAEAKWTPAKHYALFFQPDTSLWELNTAGFVTIFKPTHKPIVFKSQIDPDFLWQSLVNAQNMAPNWADSIPDDPAGLSPMERARYDYAI